MQNVLIQKISSIQKLQFKFLEKSVYLGIETHVKAAYDFLELGESAYNNGNKISIDFWNPCKGNYLVIIW